MARGTTAVALPLVVVAVPVGFVGVYEITTSSCSPSATGSLNGGHCTASASASGHNTLAWAHTGTHTSNTGNNTGNNNACLKWRQTSNYGETRRSSWNVNKLFDCLNIVSDYEFKNLVYKIVTDYVEWDRRAQS